MKKIASSLEFRAGGTYNSIYTGANSAYARINGKQTIRVLETEPKLKFVVLFDQFGDPFNEYLQGPEFSAGTETFSEVDLFEVTDESEWFKKSARFTSLQTPLEKGLITLESIRDLADQRNPSPFTAHLTGPKHTLAGVTCCFCTEDEIPDKPLLQSVYIVWENWSKLEADFKLLGIKPRT